MSTHRSPHFGVALGLALATLLVASCQKKSEETPKPPPAASGTDKTEQIPIAPTTDPVDPNPEATSDPLPAGTDSARPVSHHPGGDKKPPPPKPKPGLQLEIGPGEGANVAPRAEKTAKADRLSDAETKELVARLPKLVEQAGDAKSFAFRKRSLPAPRTGKTVKTPFPPAVRPDAPKPNVKKKPLRVLRHAPEGDVGLAPNLSVTFDQPMVAITSHAEASKVRPVVVEPEPKGQWRWVGSKTLLFEPTGRFPMATKYRVTVPANTKSRLGGTLEKAVTWTFETPAPKVLRHLPSGGPQKLEPILIVVFDQKVDPKAVLETSTVSAGSRPVAIRLATDEELKKAELTKFGGEARELGRIVAFRAKKPLPKDTTINVAIGPKTPSLEGPRTTSNPHRWSFRTYGPFRVKEHRCGWRDNCPPMQPWSIQMTNPIDSEAFDEKTLKVSPKVDGVKVSVSGRYLSVRGRTKGRTKYTLTLPKTLKDAFGQTLGKAKKLTFDVGRSEPWVSAQGGHFVVMDPSGKPALSLYSVNHDELDVRLFKVGPKDWETFKEFARTARNKNPFKRGGPPGTRVLKKRVKIDSKPDEMVETAIDLRAALKGGLGQVVVELVPTKQPNKWRREAIVMWMQRTHLGLSAFRDPSHLRAWVTDLRDGRAIEGAKVRITPSGGSGKTDAGGLAELDLAKVSDRTTRLLIAEKGDDVAILPERPWLWSSSTSWYAQPVSPQLRWYVFNDRNLYRAGETVSIKGWVRVISGGKAPDVVPLSGQKSTRWILRDARGNEIAKGKVDLNALGGFHLETKLPDEMNLGTARMTLDAVGGKVSGRTTHSFQVQEFRRPEFEVKATTSEGPHFIGAAATVTLDAHYFAGGGLPDTKVSWRVTSKLTNFTPPNRWEWSFGQWVPWWRHGPNQGATGTLYREGRTDSTGKDHLKLSFLGVEPPRPASVSVSGTVQDVNRQTWTASQSVLVHPASHYVGMKSKRSFVKAGVPLKVDFIVVDLDGKAVAARPIAVSAVRLDWRQVKGKWREVEADAQRCKLTSGADPATCTFQTRVGGTYRVRADITDDKGRRNRSQRNFWVTGGKRPAAKKVSQEKVPLIPDRKTYQPGDTAEILVQAPFDGATGLMFIEAAGTLSTKRFVIKEQSTTLKVPITDQHIPSIQVHVELTGATARLDESGEADPKLPKRPAYAAGSLRLSVPATKRTLTVTLKPEREKLEPGAATHVDVDVKDAAGKPVPGAEVALVVVDESVLALTGYKIPDPIGVFYGGRYFRGSSHHLRQKVVLASLDDLTTGAKGPGQPKKKMRSRNGAPPPSPVTATAAKPMAEAAERESDEESGGSDDGLNGNGGGKEIKLRSNFDALATFAPELPTDASGKARVKVKLPDNLTRYRIMAVAVYGHRQFGASESSMTARLPLMVRPSAPRFLNFGDRFELPVVLQNQTDGAMTVTVAISSVGVSLTEGAGRKLTVPANDRVEIRFPAAVDRAGTARFQIGAASGKWSDAAKIELPVWTPATTEAFATYGTLDKGAVVQPVRAPPDVVTQFGGLEVTTSSTALQALTDAVLYLSAYPYECAEQRSSRVMAIAALKDVLGAFKAEGLPAPKELLAAVTRDVKALAKLQNRDGGFGFWRWGERSWPYVTVHVAHALARAELKGFDVPKRMMNRLMGYLRDIERHYPHYYSEEIRRVISSYALYVRALRKDKAVAKAHKIIRAAGGPKKLPLEALGWLLTVISGDDTSKSTVAKIRRHVANRVTEDAGKAHFVTRYGDGAHLLLHSSRRVDGVLLEAMIGDQPKSTLIPKIVRGLLAHRKRGRWGNTQENAFVLVALDRYFNTYEKQTPDFVARVWLGDGYAGEHKFKGRSTDRQQIDIPMAIVAKTDQEQALTIGKEGPGRLYYRVGMRYAPKSLKLEPADHGFVVERVYTGVDDPKDVSRDKDGAWRVKAGARIRVRLTMVAEARRYHVALVDPLPAGLEPLNPALKGSGRIPPDDKKKSKTGSRSRRHWWYWGPWYEHQNLRDERAEAFSSLVWSGVYTYSYVARATTPGRFVVPPAKAEEMYHPETFGRTGTDILVVEAP